MTFQETKDFIAQCIREEFESHGFGVKQIVLFGSQSKGTAGNDSDWDLLVCSIGELDFGEKTRLTTAIRRRLAVRHICADIMVKSEEKISQEKNNVGLITYYALKDGVLV